MFTLAQLVAGVPLVGDPAIPDLPLAGLHYDSRRILPGMAFVAIRGEVADGHDFIPAALQRGAAAILAERPAPSEYPLPSGVPWLPVAHPRAALAAAAANWFHHPARRLPLVGITGTNGKTTTAFLVEAVLRAAWGPPGASPGHQINIGLLGTVEYHVGDQILPSPHTTPESYDLQELLARMLDAGCAAAVLEVSSHALALDRVWGCPFQVAVFTNLTQDHLDFHGTMERYLAAKQRLFQGLGAPPPAAAVVNADDPAAPAIAQGFSGPLWTYGFSPRAMLRAEDLENGPAGLRFTLRGSDPDGAVWSAPISSPLLGRVNALNLMAAIAAGLALGLDRDRVLAAAAAVPRVPGRFERVFAGQPFTVAVDYAHTPDALANLVALARQLAPGRVLAVFGCGGDRDRGKRPLMGRAAAAADCILVTSDNPRGEDPDAIIADILAGIPPGRAASQPDRRLAIAAALAAAQPGDIVLIAGKGHEDYQIIGGQRLPFDDAVEARRALAALGWSA